MNYAKPAFKREEVNEAGRVLRDYFKKGDDESLAHAIHAADVVDNWRASHAFPLNSFAMTLRNRAKSVSKAAVISQRTKRLPSIAFKLFDKDKMKLTQMQDIGGCRAVMPTLAQAYALRDLYLTRSLVHVPSGGGIKDYIAEPKTSGYRSVHLKYRFTGSAISLPYDQLKIEIQIRSLLQHQWATAVEAAGTFTETALKSSKGSPEWLRFFSLMSSVFALREGCPTIPGTPATLLELRQEIQSLDATHKIEATFSQYHKLMPQIENSKNARYFLVTLDPVAQTVQVKGFDSGASQLANKEYTELEKSLPKDTVTQVVLVSVSSISALKRAYPNYFLDTAGFLGEIRELLGAEAASLTTKPTARKNVSRPASALSV